jgi:GNAT superfamily N-acetyltransferase
VTFFAPDFTQDFDWKDQLHLRFGSVQPHNQQQIADGLRDLSPESIRNRFLGQKKEYTSKELHYFTHLDGVNHYALGLEERDGKQRGIAIIRLVRSSENPKDAEVAITIIDEFQRMGLGTLLLDMAILAAKERSLERLSFTFLPQNLGIIKLIHSVGIPQVGETHKDYNHLYLVLKEFSSQDVVSRWAEILPGLAKYPV